MTIGERVRRARKYAGLTQKQLAEAVGIRQPTLSDLEKGDSRSSAYLVQIARACKVNADWLATGRGEMEASNNVTELHPKPVSSGDDLVIHDTEITEGEEPLRPDEVELPYLREVEFAAGDGRTQVIENHGRTMKFSLPRLLRAGVQPHNAACATASGSSMEPTIADGSPIAIDRGCTHIIDGKIYALDHGGMLRIKRLYRLPLNRVRLVSDNSDEHPEEVYSMMGDEAPQILGRVFWWEVFD
nr:helix-turn-helix transcriptional regulator [Halomonas sp. MCCC 1A11057]